MFEVFLKVQVSAGVTHGIPPTENGHVVKVILKSNKIQHALVAFAFTGGEEKIYNCKYGCRKTLILKSILIIKSYILKGNILPSIAEIIKNFFFTFTFCVHHAGS